MGPWQAWVQAADPTGRIVPVKGPIADETLGLVRRTALELQDIAARESRSAVLVLEILPGISEFHHCYALADLLTKQPLPNVTTVAWVPEPVTGNAVMVALACQEIVMATNASLGDLGSGQALPADQQAIVKSLIARRRNLKVNEAVAAGMMDPSLALLQLTVDTGDGQRESRLVTEAEAKQLREQGVSILDSKIVKDIGVPWVVTGAQARAKEIITARAAESRRELLDTYKVELAAVRELGAAEPLGQVAYIQMHDEIDEVFGAFVTRQIERALQSQAKLIIFEIDSPGGLLFVCQDLAPLIADLREKNVKTVAYIPKKAISGGAILAVACDEIYMHPDASLGNAIPIHMVGGVVLHAPEKVLGSELLMLNKLAEQKDRPPALLESFADANLSVYEVTHKESGRKWFLSEEGIQQAAGKWVQGPRVPESGPGKALTVNGRRAHELMLAQPTVNNIEELKARLGIPAEQKFQVAGRTWLDTLIFQLNQRSVVAMLFFVAIISIYLEMATMTGFFGIISAVAFTVFFWSKVMGGTASGLEIALFVVGLACLAMEIFVVPGFGVFGVSGILLVMGSLIMASQTISGIGLSYDLERATGSVLTLGGALLAVIVCAALISANLHRIPILSDMIIAPPGHHEYGPDEPRLRPDLAGPLAALQGQSGVALSVLRPAGKARINGQLVDVVSDGPFIDAGAEIKVLQVTRNRVVVRSV